MPIMQYCSQDGKVVPLRDAADSEDLSNFSWLQILIRLTEALIFIHKKGFVHNDLKGNNRDFKIHYGEALVRWMQPKETGPTTPSPAKSRID